MYTISQFIGKYGGLIVLIVLIITIGIGLVEILTSGVKPFDAKTFIEERIHNDRVENGETSYKTKVMITLVDMNANDKVVLDVERNLHNHTINYFERHGWDHFQCADFIISSYGE